MNNEIPLYADIVLSQNFCTPWSLACPVILFDSEHETDTLGGILSSLLFSPVFSIDIWVIYL